MCGHKQTDRQTDKARVVSKLDGLVTCEKKSDENENYLHNMT